ncbi:MAG: cell wall hydrolase [Firmicutes bacterium]|nr:cell wall hydrolase [Bacillota bacterium]MDH7496696.1 cell wall hydrolase [Bacillota bacterium]
MNRAAKAIAGLLVLAAIVAAMSYLCPQWSRAGVRAWRTDDGAGGEAVVAAPPEAGAGADAKSWKLAEPGQAYDYSFDLMARVISAEAKGEPYVGQVAVGAVILNRVEHPHFPKTIPGVIFEPDAFTAVSQGTVWLQPTASSVRAAQDALSGWDPTGGALYYYNPAKATNWWITSRRYLVQIGRHVFFR